MICLEIRLTLNPDSHFLLFDAIRFVVFLSKSLFFFARETVLMWISFSLNYVISSAELNPKLCKIYAKFNAKFCMIYVKFNPKLCKIYAKFNAKLCMIYAKFNAKLFKCRLYINSKHSTPSLHNFAFFSVDTWARVMIFLADSTY